ncbi:aldose epimerase family protein [Amphibacillus sediminis]|uniref:aldose epimerase family protein n=1 Tax=Amphibacillus sediminis TaxID=360185 RepID=UPI000835A5A2|nr:aldose epimerase family protein [Amphibacillus sediminis]
MQTSSNPIKGVGTDWTEYSLINDHGMTVKFLNYGGIITTITAPDRDNHFENVVIGFDNYQDYLNNENYFGALIGRVAGRIQQGHFMLNGQSCQLPKNEGENHLHGGPAGLDKVVWQVELFDTATSAGAILSHTSNDGEGGYPGTVKLKVCYRLTNDNQFMIDYEAVSDQDTVLTLTNHSYFNLSGDLKDNILNHEVKMDSSQFVELDHDLIPTGKILSVTNTVFDFRNGRKIVDGVDSTDQQNIYAKNGYDHFFIFDHQNEEQVVVTEPISGRMLTVKTDQPGMVMYTSNGLDHTLALKERQSEKYLGVCLETQSSPASLEHTGFPSIYLPADELYRQSTTFSFKTI